MRLPNKSSSSSSSSSFIVVSSSKFFSFIKSSPKFHSIPPPPSRPFQSLKSPSNPLQIQIPKPNPFESTRRSLLFAPKQPISSPRVGIFSFLPRRFISKSNLFDPKFSTEYDLRSRAMQFSSSAGSPPSDLPPSEGMDPPSPSIHVFSTFASPFDKDLSSPPPINASSSLRKPLSLWPGMYHSPVTNALWEARSSIFERLLDGSKDAPPQAELLTKTPAQSRTSIVYNFSSDYILREQYRDAWNEVRFGKLLEDLDALAGTIAVKHCSDDDSTTRPLLVVTASVDRIVVKKPIRVDKDLKIAGAVAWVGRSSMEINMAITQIQDNSIPSDPVVLTAGFTFVARDSKTGKSAPVNRLIPETEEEKKLFEEGEAKDQLRKRRREEHKRKFERGDHGLCGEVEKLKSMLAEGRVFCDMPALADRNSILISDTRLENSLVCQPQQRNLHGRIFGGFLMHQAFQLAFSTAYAFVGQRPWFLEVDHVDFLKPVDVGDFLRFKSCVLYTQLENPEQPLINIEVEAHVIRPEFRSSEVSNTFYFTFTVSHDVLRNGQRIRNVVPNTEEEARRVLERIEAEKVFG